jgi:hypothetical protein
VIDMGRAGVAFVSEVSVNEKSRVIMSIRLPSDNAQKPPIEVQAEGLVTSTILTRAGFRSGINFKNFITGEEEFLKRCP